MRAIAEVAEQAGVIAVHENEKEIYGDIPRRCLDIVTSVDSPNLKLAWDPANFVQCGVKPFTEGYEALRPHTVYIQIKDALVRRLLGGGGRRRRRSRSLETIRALRGDGFDGFFSLEPHLATQNALGGFSGAELWTQAHAAFTDILHSEGIRVRMSQEDRHRRCRSHRQNARRRDQPARRPAGAGRRRRPASPSGPSRSSMPMAAGRTPLWPRRSPAPRSTSSRSARRPGLHGALAIEALAAGKDVIIEKPAEITGQRTDEIIAAQQASGRLVTVISQHRFDPATEVTIEAITKGELGRLTSGIASIDWWRGQTYYDSGDWRGTWELDGGGALMNQGVHTVDLLVATLGRPVEVFAYTGTLAHERIEVEDVAVGVVRFESGALGCCTRPPPRTRV